MKRSKAPHKKVTWRGIKAGSVPIQDVLVLLDLLGAPDPVFFSYFSSTEKWYVRLAAAEQRLAELDKLEGYSKYVNLYLYSLIHKVAIRLTFWWKQEPTMVSKRIVLLRESNRRSLML